MNAFVAWILAAAIHFAPPERHPRFDGYEETAEQARARYEQIAIDIAAAVEGRKDAKDMAALALAWAVGESALAPDADKGPCYRKGRWKLRCDGGLAAGPWQLHEYWDRQAKERVTVAAIFADRARSAKTVVRKLIGAWVQCAHLASEDRLSGFGLGHCEAGNASVRARYRLWQRVRAWEPQPPAASSGTMEPKQTRAAVVKASNAIVAIVDLYAGIVAEQDGEVASYKVALEALQQQVEALKAELARELSRDVRDEVARCKAELVQREDDVTALKASLVRSGDAIAELTRWKHEAQEKERGELDAQLRDLAQSIAKRDEKIEALEQALRLRVLPFVSGKPLLVAPPDDDGANSFVWQVEADDGNGVLWICDEDAPRWVIELCNVVVDLERRTMKTRGGWRGPCSAMRLQQAAGVVLARQIMVSMVALANASAASSGA